MAHPGLLGKLSEFPAAVPVLFQFPIIFRVICYALFQVSDGFRVVCINKKR